jgi:hypothetical protein
VILNFSHISLDANPLMVAYEPWKLEKRGTFFVGLHMSGEIFGPLTQKIVFLQNFGS